MIIDTLLEERGITKYRLAAQAGLSNATLSEICCGKTRLEKCSAETVYKLAKALHVSMETLTEYGLEKKSEEGVVMMRKKAKNDLKIICRMIRNAIDVNEIYLFGSYAYGVPNKDSDYDLCVVIPDSEMRPVDAVKKIRRAIYPVQSNPMDVVVYHSSRFRERQRSASLERKIAREGVLLYEQTGLEQRMV